MTSIPQPGDVECAPSATRAIGHDVAVSLASTLKALAEPLRLRILSAIAADPRGESCVCDLIDLAQVSQPTVSHHLKVLRGTGLVCSERRGTWVWYRIAPGKHAAVTALLDAFASATATRDPADGQARSLANVDDYLTHVAIGLADEFTEVHRDVVTTIVRDSYTGLVRSAKTSRDIVGQTERFARQRLADITRKRGDAVPQVLFVCVQNAGRSQLAAALVNELSQGAVIARSAGSNPASEVHRHVQPLLGDLNEESSAIDAFPKPLTDDAVRAADVVITMGCGDVCPTIAGVRYEDWAIGDPALASREGVMAIRHDLEARVRRLLATLNPLTKDKL